MPGRTLPWPTDVMNLFFVPRANFTLPIISSSFPPPPRHESRILTKPVSMPPGIRSPSASDADHSCADFRPVDCSMPFRVDDAFSFYGENDSDWGDAWHVQPSCLASRREIRLAHLHSEREPGPLRSQPPTHHTVVPVLRHDHRNRRPSDRQQFLSWNPGPTRGADRVCWQAILAPRGMLSVCRRAPDSATTSPSRKFLRGCRARLRRPRQQGHFRAKLFVCSALHPWQVDVCYLGCCGHGCYWQVPQSSR